MLKLILPPEYQPLLIQSRVIHGPILMINDLGNVTINDQLKGLPSLDSEAPSDLHHLIAQAIIGDLEDLEDPNGTCLHTESKIWGICQHYE